jgi:tetratricopeptide (TPR) repeat protein
MSSTLIVSDALSLLLGEERGQRELEAHLRDRVEAARAVPEETLLELFELLAPTAGEDAQAEVLQAALVLALAHPRLAERFELSSAIHGRRLAARLERDGDVAGACGTLRLVCEVQPGNRTIERALASLMRRQGMVQDLVDRYLARAQLLLDQGHHQEAVPWLREVLQLDRSRKDVARTIRDLCFEQVAEVKARGRRWYAALALVIAAGAIALVALREVYVRKNYETLPEAGRRDLTSLRYRLEALEGFVERYPVWHGALSAIQERSELRIEIAQMNADELRRREEDAEARRRSDSMADSARLQATHHAENGDFQAALGSFKQALELASESWPYRPRTERDVEAIVAHLAQEEAR